MKVYTVITSGTGAGVLGFTESYRTLAAAQAAVHELIKKG